MGSSRMSPGSVRDDIKYYDESEDTDKVFSQMLKHKFDLFRKMMFDMLND